MYLPETNVTRDVLLNAALLFARAMWLAAQPAAQTRIVACCVAVASAAPAVQMLPPRAVLLGR